MTTAAHRKIAAGEYETLSGYDITRSWGSEATRGGEWHVIDPEGEYCQTYPTLRDALEAVARIESTHTLGQLMYAKAVKDQRLGR